MKEKNYKFDISVAEAASRQITKDIVSLISSIMEKSGSEASGKKQLTRLPGGLILPVSESSCTRYEYEHLKGWTIIGIAAGTEKSEPYIVFKGVQQGNFFVYLKPEDLSLTLRTTILTFLVFWNGRLTASGTKKTEEPKEKTGSEKAETASAADKPSKEAETNAEQQKPTEETPAAQEPGPETADTEQATTEPNEKTPLGVDPKIKIDYSIFG